MTKMKAVWTESRRCLVCNDLDDKERKVGFIKDPNDPDKWVSCTCNSKGYIRKTGTLSA
jgi:hypothetical protein